MIYFIIFEIPNFALVFEQIKKKKQVLALGKH